MKLMKAGEIWRIADKSISTAFFDSPNYNAILTKFMYWREPFLLLQDATIYSKEYEKFRILSLNDGVFGYLMFKVMNHCEKIS